VPFNAEGKASLSHTLTNPLAGHSFASAGPPVTTPFRSGPRNCGQSASPFADDCDTSPQIAAPHTRYAINQACATVFIVSDLQDANLLLLYTHSEESIA
jgi:hypothetical protein